ncbi:kelch-like protein 10 isoform X1 [Ciona intestinalis]
MALCLSDSETSMLTSPLLVDSWASTFNDLRQRGKFCDVVIKVQDVRFPLHRLVLCACSDYFRALFDGGWGSGDKQEIELTGTSPEIMTSLLNYAYTGQVIITSQNVEELLPASDKFLMDYVKQKCCSYLKKQLTPMNCIGIRQYARSFFCPRLVDAANNFILYNFEEVAQKSPEFLNMAFDDVIQLINDDRLNVRLEETVCESVFRWIRHDKMGRISNLSVMLKGVRLGLLDPEYFMTKLKGNFLSKLRGCELVTESMAECRGLIKDAMKVVCDLHGFDSNTVSPHGNVFSSLVRPRLPFEILLAIGGWSGGSPTNAIEAYDPRAESWLNASTIPDSDVAGGYRTVADIPRAYHGVAFVKGNVYVIGGFDGVNYFNTVRRFSVANFEWVEEPQMLHKRCYISVTVLDKKIYALGGMDGTNRLNSAECYDPSQKIWSILPDMNESRSDSSATSLHGRVYIAGGFNGQECLFTAEFYDPETSVWTRITPMRSRRSGVSIISFHDMVYAVGGFDGVNRLRHAEAYCPRTNTWRNIASMNKPRSNFGIEVVDDQLLVVGGYNGHQTSWDVEAYDDTANEWYEIKDMHICRSALSCCVMSGVPYDVIKRYCVPRDTNPTSSSPDTQDGATSSINPEDAVLSERSGITTDDEEDQALHQPEVDLRARNDHDLSDDDEMEEESDL